jgi:hypothetical protein
MSRGYASIALTGEVRAEEERLCSAPAMARRSSASSSTTNTTDTEPRDALTAAERTFISRRDGFYLASVSSTGWPYVQFRGGPAGFVKSPDEHTLAWADFRGNRQYISTGNIAAHDRVALFFMDYPNQLRLKVFGHAQVTLARDQPEQTAELTTTGYRAIIEQLFTISVVAYDWNCPQHITPRFTLDELTEQM